MPVGNQQHAERFEIGLGGKVMTIDNRIERAKLFEDLWSSLPESCHEKYEKSGAMSFFYRGFAASQATESQQEIDDLKADNEGYISLANETANTIVKQSEEARKLHATIAAQEFKLISLSEGLLNYSYELARQALRISELEARLEIDPRHKVDGIDARNETIHQLDKKLAAQELRISELEKGLTILNDEYNRLPHSLGYQFTHTPEIDKLLSTYTTTAHLDDYVMSRLEIVAYRQTIECERFGEKYTEYGYASFQVMKNDLTLYRLKESDK